jgi:hypothetical protein
LTLANPHFDAAIEFLSQFLTQWGGMENGEFLEGKKEIDFHWFQKKREIYWFKYPRFSTNAKFAKQLHPVTKSSPVFRTFSPTNPTEVWSASRRTSV